MKQLSDGSLIVAVIDTHVEVYSPSHPALIPRGDRIVAEAILTTIAAAGENDLVLDIVLRSNWALRERLEIENQLRKDRCLRPIDLNDAARIPGGVAVIAKIDLSAGYLEMFQNCDAWCIYPWRCGWQITPYRNHEAEKRHQETVQDLLIVAGGDKKEMWNLFYAPLSESRRDNNNRSRKVVIINGTSEFDALAETQIVDGEVHSGLVFGTDGSLYDPYSFPKERHRLMYKWLANEKPLDFLEWNRALQREMVDKSHVDGGIPEATILEMKLI